MDEKEAFRQLIEEVCKKIGDKIAKKVEFYNKIATVPEDEVIKIDVSEWMYIVICEDRIKIWVAVKPKELYNVTENYQKCFDGTKLVPYKEEPEIFLHIADQDYSKKLEEFLKKAIQLAYDEYIDEVNDMWSKGTGCHWLEFR